MLPPADQSGSRVPRVERPSAPVAGGVQGVVGDAGYGMGGGAGRRRWISWSKQTLLFAVALSAFVHVLVAYLMVQGGSSGGRVGAESASEGEQAAVLSRVEFAGAVSTSLASASDVEIEFRDPAADVSFVDPGASTNLAALESGNVGDLGGATVDGEGELGGAAASFFGVAARGTRFAYIVDISGSMTTDRMGQLIRALSVSLGQLLSEARYVVAMYNDKVQFAGQERWNRPTGSSINRTLGAISVYAMSGVGGTQPLPAFERVFSMRPKPDAVYFMTDGIFGGGDRLVERQVIARIQRMNMESGRLTAIHCITFIEDRAADVMRRIAADSGGTYTHVNALGEREDRTDGGDADGGE